MTTAKALMSTLKAFHLDRPEATWSELRDHLKEIAEGILQTSTEWERRDEQGLLYADWASDLRGIVSTQGFTVDQAKAADIAREIMQAAGERLEGDSSGLRAIIGKLNEDALPDSVDRSSVNLSVFAPQAAPQVNPNATQTSPVPTGQPLSYRTLSALQLKERQDDIAPRSLANYMSNDRLLSEALETLGVCDMRIHTRADLVKLKEYLSPDRKGSSLNALLNRLSTVLKWATNNGYINHAYDKGLKVTGKGVLSGRRAFTKGQQVAIMDHCNSLPGDSWVRWMLALGTITGARIGELRQLLKEDVQKVADSWTININTNHGKNLKNSHSARVVPLVDGALGFDLPEFLKYVESLDGPTDNLCPYQESTAAQGLNGELRAVLKMDAGGSLSFHSLRHSMAGRFKEQDVSLTIAGAVLGHTSQSITYDHYGKGQGMDIRKLEEGIRVAFEMDPIQHITNQGSETK